MNGISNNKNDHPELLVISSVNKPTRQKPSRFSKTLNNSFNLQSEDYQSQSSRNPSVINLNMMNFEESFRSRKEKKKNKSESKKQAAFVKYQARGRYPQLYREMFGKEDKIKAISKYNNLLLGQNPVKRYIKIEKLCLPKAKNQERSLVQTQTLEKELIVMKKNTTSQIDYEMMMRQTLQQYDNFSKRFHDKGGKQASHRNYSTIMESQCPKKQASTSRGLKKSSISSKKYFKNEIPIRKPTVKKDYFVFGMGDRANSENKLQIFRDFLWKINYSNGLYVSTPQTVLNPYKAYVGGGNNSYLIKGILKRRYWWTIVDKSEPMEGVNFLWSQLKMDFFFKKQRKGLKASLSESGENWEYYNKATQHERKIFGKNDFRNWRKHVMKNQRVQKKITQNTYIKRSMLCQLKAMSTVQFSEAIKIHNHLSTNFYIGNKKALFYNLRKYCMLRKTDPFTIIPITFHLTKGVEDPEYNKFFQMHESFEEMKKQQKNLKNMWIVKPGENTNRGNGISVCQNLDEILIRLKGRQKNSDGKTRTFILQKYLEKPLLYQKRKFDIRHFMLVTCINGNFKAYWYEEGYLRTSSNEYNLKNSKDTLVHLTNDAIQKSCPFYGKYQKGNKLSYNQFQKYLESQKKVSFYEGILPKMKEIGTQTVKATYSLLDEHRKSHNFQLLGLDFMIDENLNPWLIEVNTNPCLEMSCSLLTRLIPQMIDNVFKICIDPLFPPPQNWQSGRKFYFGDNPLAQNKFDIVFDELSDGKNVEKLYQNCDRFDEKMGKIQADNQQFEDDGDEEWETDRK